LSRREGPVKYFPEYQSAFRGPHRRAGKRKLAVLMWRKKPVPRFLLNNYDGRGRVGEYLERNIPRIRYFLNAADKGRIV